MCEHVQAPGAECQVCGKPFTTGPAGDRRPVASLEGLEQTQLPGADAPLNIPALGELEATRFQAGAAPPSETVPDLEPTLSVDVWGFGEPVAALADLDTGRTLDTEPRVPVASGPLTCRYCRHVQLEGLLCERCGMRLPRTRAGGTSGPLATDEGERMRCPSCAVWVRAGQTCGGCGTVASR